MTTTTKTEPTPDRAKHTAGRLIAASAISSVVGLPIVAQSGRSIANVMTVPFGFSGAEQVNSESLANARRLAACWNACIGISTEELEAAAMLKAREAGHG
jgi:hypothetical protein